MGLKKIKTLLLKPHHIAFSGLSLLIIAALVWYFYSGRHMEGFFQGKVEKCSSTKAYRDCVSAIKLPGNTNVKNYVNCINNYSIPESCAWAGNPSADFLHELRKEVCKKDVVKENAPGCDKIKNFTAAYSPR